MQINALNNSSVTFKGISKIIGKRYPVNNAELFRLQSFQNNAYSSNIVGSIPHGWIKNVPPEKRKDFAKSVYDILGFHANLARMSDDYVHIYTLKDELRQIGLDVEDIIYYDEGAFGVVSKIIVNEDDKEKNYAYKVFKSKVEKQASHGSLSEIVLAKFIQSNLKEPAFAKFYFGDLSSAYMVSEYINSPSPGKKNRHEFLGFMATDYCPSNLVYDKVIDYGGFRIANELYKNKELRKKSFYISHLPENQRKEKWDELYLKMCEKPDKDTIYMLNLGIMSLPFKYKNESYNQLINSLDILDGESKKDMALATSSMLQYSLYYMRTKEEKEYAGRKLLSLNIPEVSRNTISSLRSVKLENIRKLLSEYAEGIVHNFS